MVSGQHVNYHKSSILFSNGVFTADKRLFSDSSNSLLKWINMWAALILTNTKKSFTVIKSKLAKN